MNGILNIYKEQGFTSHDVVAKLRGILGQKKIGHTGTLDPMAEGVLPVCLGNATKVCGLLTDKDKTYQTVLRLGVVTDTQDMTGKAIGGSTPLVTREMATEAVFSFLGPYEQIPPMYSAIKINGKKLYEMAREGKVVERKPRRVFIHQIAIEDIDLLENRITMTVSCSKGTYIRTLCEDIGNKLKCGGCMESLLRIRVGSFFIKDSIRLDEVERLEKEGSLKNHILPVEQLFNKYQAVVTATDGDKLLFNGNRLARNKVREQNVPADLEKVRMFDSSGTFAGIYHWNEAEQVYEPVKMFL